MTTKDYAESFGLTIGESKRMDCPECGRKNTFSISNINGTIKWNCFHASCDERGTGSLKVTRRNAADILSLTRKENSLTVQVDLSVAHDLNGTGTVITGADLR